MSARTYKPTLVRMMAYLDDQDYNNDQEFTIARLGQLTASDVMKWINFEVFGVPEPPEGHDLNPLLRSNTLKFGRKLFLFLC